MNSIKMCLKAKKGWKVSGDYLSINHRNVKARARYIAYERDPFSVLPITFGAKMNLVHLYVQWRKKKLDILRKCPHFHLRGAKSNTVRTHFEDDSHLIC